MKLNDVDFITEYNNNIIFLEYKNANIKDVINPNAFVDKIKKDPEKFYKNIAKQYYDSLLMFWATGGNKIGSNKRTISIIGLHHINH